VLDRGDELFAGLAESAAFPLFNGEPVGEDWRCMPIRAADLYQLARKGALTKFHDTLLRGPRQRW